ncbi:MAG: hypothetical protein PVI90_00095 [Desulfobacteraceae bacterium]|jgi:hypothetical protein
MKTSKEAQLPSQYSYGGYSTAMDDLGLLPGVAPQRPQGDSTNWLVPLGLLAGGLTGYSLLRGAGRNIKGLFNKFRKTPMPHEPWNWEMEMLGRGQKRYQSLAHPGEAIGHSYGPGPEAIVKQSNDLAYSRIITQLARIAANK